MDGDAEPKVVCMGPHPCPGLCGNSVDAREFCCQPCWFRLPPRIRILLWKSWENVPVLVAEAVAAGIEFFRNNPLLGVDTDHHGG